MSIYFFNRNKKFIELLYFGVIIFTILIYIWWIYESRSLWAPFESRGVDGYFFLYIATIILSIITVIRLTKFYYEFGSLEFLLVAFITHCIGFSFWFGQTYLDYILDSQSSFSLEGVEILVPEITFLVTLVMFGYFLLIPLSINAIGWSNIGKVTKVLVIVSLYFSSIIFLVEFENTIRQIISGKPEVGADTFVYNLYFYEFGDFSQPWYLVFAATTIQSFQYIILISIFLRVKSPVENKTITITKYTWISVFVVFLFVRIYADYLNVNVGDYTGAYRVWAIGSFFGIAIFAIMLSLFPEALLITTSQLYRADRLYKFTKRQSSNVDGISILNDYKARIKDYVDSLPSEIREQIINVKQ